jgi:putative N6-adenine-specific DNA methylase
MHLFATAAPGTEGALRDELRELRFHGVRADRGGVHFEGEIIEAGRACLESRIAVRVLVEIGEFDAPTERLLYEGVREIDWSPFLSPKHTLAVSSVARASRLFHTKFLAQKTKDGIVDQLRDQFGERPSVDTENADVRVFLYLVKDRASIFLDAAGTSLHKRGWRARIGEAPLKETMAAACLRLSGWDRKSSLVDPMCGSGTIAIEADLWARNVAPGIHHEKFGLERWASCDDALRERMRDLRDRARIRVRQEGPSIRGFDIDARVLEHAKENAREARSNASFALQSVRDLKGATFIVTNPPYGIRLEASQDLYRDMAKSFRAQKGARIAIVAGTPDIQDAMGRPEKWQSLAMGPLEVRLLIYDT